MDGFFDFPATIDHQIVTKDWILLAKTTIGCHARVTDGDFRMRAVRIRAGHAKKGVLLMEETNRFYEAGSVVGITSGITVMLVAFFMAEVSFLAIPGLTVLVPSLLYATR